MKKAKVFGIGWAKTGTTTLDSCLQQLGYNHTSGRLDMAAQYLLNYQRNICKTIDQFDSFEDWP